MKKVRLALSGSGFLAPVHAGVVCALMDAGVKIVEVAGTSGGSIVAAIVASGRSSKDIKRISFEPLPADILRRGYFGAIGRQGLNDGSILHEWLNDLVGGFTLRTAKIPITIMATDINAGCSFKFSAKATPYTSLADACRASASVPFVFSPANVAGKKLVDGGMCCNIPVDQLVDDQIPRLGIEVIDGTPDGLTATLPQFALQCLSTMMASNEDNLVAWAKQTGATILPVNARPFGFLDAALPLSAKKSLFDRGYAAVADYIDSL